MLSHHRINKEREKNWSLLRATAWRELLVQNRPAWIRALTWVCGSLTPRLRDIPGHQSFSSLAAGKSSQGNFN